LRLLVQLGLSRWHDTVRRFSVTMRAEGVE
jgi:hypothetical protein